MVLFVDADKILRVIERPNGMYRRIKIKKLKYTFTSNSTLIDTTWALFSVLISENRVLWNAYSGFITDLDGNIQLHTQ
jgi:hypothetical protein